MERSADEKSNRKQDVLLEFLAVSFLATGGIFVRLSSIPPVATGFFRVLFSLPVLFLLARKELKNISKKDWAVLLLGGFFLAGDITMWNLSFGFTSVANANLFANLTPLTVIPVAWLLFREKPSRFFLAGTGVTLAGVVVLLGGKANPTSGSFIGDLLSFGASFFYAGFILVTYRLRAKYGSNAIMFASGIGSALALFVSSNIMEDFRCPASARELFPVLGLTFCLQLVGHNLMAHCQGKVSVYLSTTICLLQPVIASLYSLFLFGERITAQEIAGIVIVVAGIFIVQLKKK